MPVLLVSCYGLRSKFECGERATWAEGKASLQAFGKVGEVKAFMRKKAEGRS